MRLRFLLASLALVLVASAVPPAAAKTRWSVPLPEVRGDLLSTARSVLATHPLFATSAGAAEARDYRAYVRRLAGGLREPLPLWRVLGDEDLVLNYLHDPHTDLWADYSPSFSPDLLPVGFHWAKGGLVVFRIQDSPAAVRTGDRVLAIDGVPTAGVMRRLTRYASGNVEWLRQLAGEMLPYGNTLRWLGLVQGQTVPIRVAGPSGAQRTLSLELLPADEATDIANIVGQERFVDRFEAPPGLSEPYGREFYAYRVGRRYAVFWLTSCDDTVAFGNAVNSFFRKVRAEHTRTVVVDLQQNPGGNSAAGDDFMAHLPVRAAYAMSYPRSADVFRGRLYVLIDNGTMSSGVLIAEYLSEAGYGVLAGERAGLASGAWGNVQGFATPDGIGYQVSTMFEAPVNGVQTKTLTPAVQLPLTVRDVQDGVDPVARWLKAL